MRVRDVMTKGPVTVPPTATVLTARRLMHARAIRHLPVVDGGRVVGMLSDRDVRPPQPALLEPLSPVQADLLSGNYRPVRTVMSSPAQCAWADDDLRTAAKLMAAWRISALPVVEHGRLVGIVTATDCLHALATGRPKRTTLRPPDPHPVDPRRER